LNSLWLVIKRSGRIRDKNKKDEFEGRSQMDKKTPA